MKGVAYVSGKYVPLKDAAVSILDLGLIHGDATYDVVHVIDGKFFLLDWHIERFFHSARGLRLEIPHSEKEVVNVLRQCVRKAKFSRAFVWMVCTRGIPKSGIPRDLYGCKPQFFAYAKPYYDILTKDKLHRGVSLLVSKVSRIPKSSIDPTMKNFQWGDFTNAQFEALDAEFDTAVLLDQRGYVTEGPGFNVALVKGKEILMPASGALKGVTQRALMHIARECGFRPRFVNVTQRVLLNADEIFLTSTSSGILPVTRLKAGPRTRTLHLGPVTQALIENYWKKHDDPKWTTPVSGR